MTRLALLASLLVFFLLPAPARAEDRYASGLYAEMGIGGHAFLGNTGLYAAPGPGFGLRVGYDLFSWFSVGGLLHGTIHEATVPPPPEREYFQLYHAGGDGQLRARFGRVGVFAEGSVGMALISTNVLDKVGVTDPDERLSPFFSGGGGLDYHIQSRHFSLGLAGDYTIYPLFDASSAVTVRLYLRYTR